jgi:hypothetical protein
VKPSLLRASATAFVMGIAPLLCPSAQAIPVLNLQSDWGSLFVEGLFDDQAGYWSDSYDGPVLGGISLQVNPVADDEFGRPNSFTVFASVSEPAAGAGSSIGAATVIEPAFGNTLGYHGRADVDVTWSFTVGAEPAQFHADAQGFGGSTAQAGFTLYDETDASLVASLNQGPGGGASGTLLSEHEYTMNFFSHSVTTGNGDPFGVFEFFTDATIVPGPTSAALLVLVIPALRRRSFCQAHSCGAAGIAAR